MNWIQGLQASLSYLEENLLAEIEIETVASVALSSSFHYQRIFHTLTNMTVKDYIRKRRLTLAAIELVETETKVIDLAIKYGYESSEAFAKAFRKQHFGTPMMIRKGELPIVHYNPLVIQLDLKGSEPMEVKIIEKECIRILGKRYQISLTDEENLREIPKIWNEINAAGFPEKVAAYENGEIPGILGVCRSLSHDEMEYWIGVTSDEENSELESFTIEGAKWAVFTVVGPLPGSIQKGWEQIMREWLPTSGYELNGDYEIEVYSDEAPDKDDLASWIWLPIK